MCSIRSFGSRGDQRDLRLRPSGQIELAVLIDRGGRELPIEASYVGAHVSVARELSIVLNRIAGRFELSVEPATSGPRA
jgi:pyrimidine operon attenuation protein/uracil phosphoribosyltransferase